VANRNISVTAGDSIGITLTGSDFDGDTLSFAVATQPSHGSLTGTEPNLTYTPSAGFSGIDNFTYNANDGTVTSSNATVTINVQSVSNNGLPSNLANNLTIDGNLVDWASFQSFGIDANDSTGTNNPIDYQEAWMAHDTANFYLAYRNNGPSMATIGSWGFNAYLDTDRNISTGFSSGLAIGADFLQQGDFLFRYTGDGNSWSWEVLGSVTRQVSTDSAEISFDRNAIDNPETLDIVILGDNIALGGNIEDSYPDGARISGNDVRYFSYTTGGTLVAAQGEPNLGAALSNTPAENGLLELQANARRPDSSLAQRSGGSGGGGSGIPLVIALLGIWVARTRIKNIA